MKKKLLILSVFALVSAATFAQPRAIGARFTNGFEVSYQHALDDNMLSADLGYSFGAWGFGGQGQAVVTYDWIFPINSSGAGEWNWYAGAGAGVSAGWNSFGVGVAGRIGVEYMFDFPLQLSVDYRPVIGPQIFYTGGVGFNAVGLYGSGAFGLSARYIFE